MNERRARTLLDVDLFRRFCNFHLAGPLADADDQPLRADTTRSGGKLLECMNWKGGNPLASVSSQLHIRGEFLRLQQLLLELSGLLDMINGDVLVLCHLFDNTRCDWPLAPTQSNIEKDQ